MPPHPLNRNLLLLSHLSGSSLQLLLNYSHSSKPLPTASLSSIYILSTWEYLLLSYIVLTFKLSWLDVAYFLLFSCQLHWHFHVDAPSAPLSQHEFSHFLIFWFIPYNAARFSIHLLIHTSNRTSFTEPSKSFKLNFTSTLLFESLSYLWLFFKPIYQFLTH